MARTLTALTPQSRLIALGIAAKVKNIDQNSAGKSTAKWLKATLSRSEPCTAVGFGPGTEDQEQKSNPRCGPPKGQPNSERSIDFRWKDFKLREPIRPHHSHRK